MEINAQPLPPGSHIVVGLSGGVDSAVSAWLLKQQGYRVTALFMVNWEEDEDGYCTAADDFQDCRAIAEEIGIPLQRVDFSADYKDRVFAQFLADYAAGRTPNPDVLCNREVKFQPFREYALRLGADGIATGHYARIHHGPDGPRLLRSVTEDKDQTYFLAAVHRAQLENVMFPIGHLEKPQVRRLALEAGLPVHRKKDSTGICFIGERRFRDFLAQHLKDVPGAIVDTAGVEVGRHPGLHHFTLGQRKGLHIGGRRGAREAPWYVVGKRQGLAQLVVSQDAADPRMLSQRLDTLAFHWIRQPSPLPTRLTARIRHRQALQACTVAPHADGSLEVRFETPQRAAAPGQYVVLYDGLECLGSGEIRHADPLHPLD